jgi:flagellar biosynthesis/type III secretory pathway M-ring protein FliF/YscJ
MPPLVEPFAAAGKARALRQRLALAVALALTVTAAGTPAGAAPEQGAPEGDAPGFPQQIALRAALERDIDGKVARVLEPLVGSDGFVVRTTAEMDFAKVLRREKSIDPDSAVVLTEERSKEKPAAASARQEQRASYEYSVRESSIEQPAGQLLRLSVAVLVDQRRSDDGGVDEPAGTAGAGPRATPRSDEEIAQIEELIKGAIGFDARRGDRVTVEQVAFRRAPVVTPAAGLDPRSWPPRATGIALFALALAAFALLARPLLARLRPAANGALPAAAGGLQPAAAGSGTLPAGRPSPVEALRQRLAAVAVEEPEGMAQTLRVWLHESRRERQP